MVVRRIVVVALGLVVAVGAGRWAFQDARARSASTPPQDTFADKAAVEAREAARVAELDAIAASRELRAEVLARKEADRAARAAASTAPETVEPWPEGIFEDPEAPFPGMEFLGTNRWVGRVGGHTVAVFAGRSGSDESVGRLQVVVAGRSMNVESGATVALAGAGALRVVSAEGAMLTIADAHGGTHTFDVLAQRFFS
ncbi:MAG TPA: hypothetical protein VLC50_02265 [Actinomycetes bacterium]|nr:hypothetical protein [Actinomycetes bacterium]